MRRRRILIINGGCLKVNSSATLCHIAYIQGFIDCGCEVVVVSKNAKNQVIDKSIVLPKQAKYYEYDGSFLAAHSGQTVKTTVLNTKMDNSLTGKLVACVKKLINIYYGPLGVAQAWVDNVGKEFKDEVPYDLILTLSGPIPSHMAGVMLLEKGAVKTNSFCELWEDPWQNDILATDVGKDKLKVEEHMIRNADHVLYVSPLTLLNQKKLFPNFVNKMDWLPLSAYYSDDTRVTFAVHIYGYFGDYYPEARNIIPFYEAAKTAKTEVYICGNPSDLITSAENIKVMPRMTLEELKKFEDKTNVLVIVCNLRGGQIPGKIYQYAATRKKILFILDGEENEKIVLKEYFSQFNRFYFCENDKKSIMEAMGRLEQDKQTEYMPLECFTPKNIAAEIMKKCGM